MSTQFSFISNLSESHLIPARESLTKYTAKEIAELTYLHILALRILLAEHDTNTFASSFCRRTTRTNDFQQWRSDGTDLYVLLHALANSNEKIGGSESEIESYRNRFSIYPSMVFRWIQSSGEGIQRESETKTFITNLDGIFRVNDHIYKSTRRLVQDWPNLSHSNRRLAMTRILKLLREKGKGGELLDNLSRLANLKEYEIIDQSDDKLKEQPKKNRFLLSLQNETATSGGTCAANIAAVPGAIGAGFDNDFSKSVYPAPKTKRINSVISRNLEKLV